MCEAAYPTKGHREPDYLPGGAVAVQLSNRLKIHPIALPLPLTELPSL